MSVKNNILNELIDKQRKNVYYSKKLSYRDLNRITKYIDKSIFGDECCIWNGYITNADNNYYVNFFFKNKKTNLQKLIYINYVGQLDNKEYVKYSCENPGKCCNINHMIKYVPENKHNNSDSDTDSESNTESDFAETNIDDFIVTF